MIQQLAKKTYEAARILNLEFQKGIPELSFENGFFWPRWEFVQPNMRKEYLITVNLALQGKILEPAERHAVAVVTRLADGWRIGKEKNNLAKIDPYLIPWADLPDWLRSWAAAKDQLFYDMMRSWKK
jgi:hypothetical protein